MEDTNVFEILGALLLIVLIGLLLIPSSATAPTAPTATPAATKAAQLQARQVSIGMTPGMVSAAWGQPDKIFQVDAETWYIYYFKGLSTIVPNTLYSTEIGEGISTHAVFRGGRVAEIREADIGFGDLDIFKNRTLDDIMLIFGRPHHCDIIQGTAVCTYRSYVTIFLYFTADGRLATWSRYSG